MTAVLVWRAAVYFELWSWGRAAVDLAVSFRDMADGSAGALDWLEDAWADGSLDGPCFFAALLAAVLFVMMALRAPKEKSYAKKPRSPPESDLGTESGHLISDDEG